MFSKFASYAIDDKEMDFDEFTMVVNKLTTGKIKIIIYLTALKLNVYLILQEINIFLPRLILKFFLLNSIVLIIKEEVIIHSHSILK